MAQAKLSELTTIDEVKSADLLYISDSDTYSSRKTTVGQVFSASSTRSLGDYEDNQYWELQAGLATGTLFVKELTIGG